MRPQFLDDPLYKKTNSKFMIFLVIVTCFLLSVFYGWLACKFFTGPASNSSLIHVGYYVIGGLFAISSILLVLFPFVKTIRHFINNLEFPRMN